MYFNDEYHNNNNNNENALMCDITREVSFTCVLFLNMYNMQLFIVIRYSVTLTILIKVHAYDVNFYMNCSFENDH